MYEGALESTWNINLPAQHGGEYRRTSESNSFSHWLQRAFTCRRPPLCAKSDRIGTIQISLIGDLRAGDFVVNENVDFPESEEKETLTSHLSRAVGKKNGGSVVGLSTRRVCYEPTFVTRIFPST